MPAGPRCWQHKIFDTAVLQVVQPEDSTEQLVSISKVCRAVRRRKQPLLLWDDVRYYAGVILCANIEDPQAREQHLSQIDDEIAYRRFALRRGLCPRCGKKPASVQGNTCRCRDGCNQTIPNAAIRWKMKCSEKVKLCKFVFRAQRRPYRKQHRTMVCRAEAVGDDTANHR